MSKRAKVVQNNALDLIGIGVGPFNLGLAALLEKVKDAHYLFLEKKKTFSWHEDMILNNSKLQVHYLKDLVSLVDPTNRLSFLSYLVENERAFQFIHRKEQAVSRAEFNSYYKWAAKKIDKIQFDCQVQSVDFDNKQFIIKTPDQTYQAKNIVIGTGATPFVPDSFKPSLSPFVFHNSDYKKAKAKLDFANKKIAVIGGGQSGAEIFDDLLSLEKGPAEIAWITRRTNFYPLEDACFSNEFYSPSFVKYFYNLPQESKIKKLNDLLLTSDGISEDLANTIYNKIYDARFINKSKLSFCLLLNHIVASIDNTDGRSHLEIINVDKQQSTFKDFDIVILATGYKCGIPNFLKNLLPNIKNYEDLELNPDYSVKWPNHDNKIFIQNGLKQQFGIADANLSLATWRNAVIINGLTNKNIYNTDCCSSLFTNEVTH